MSAQELKSKAPAVAHAGALAGLVAIAAFCLGLLLFIFDLRDVAQSVDESNRDLRATLIARCEARVEYDKRFVAGAEGDARFYGELLAAAGMIDPKTLPPDVAKVQEVQQQAILDAQERKVAIVEEGVIENCDELSGRS